MARPKTTLLTRSRIARAALARVRATGGFTIPALAGGLGVHPSSLYHHVRGKAEIIRLAREELYAAIDLGPCRDSAAPWQTRLERWVVGYRDATAQAPGVVPLLIGAAVDDPRTLEIYEALFEILADAGVPRARRVAVSAMIDAVVLGSAVDAGSPTPLWLPQDDAFPRLREATAHADDGDRALAGLALAVPAVVAAVERAAG